jgi:hypothetical protein
MCGRCHASEARAFGESAHQKLLLLGDETVPSCTSCHSSMATEVPSPAELERQCGDCHRDDRQRATLARRELEDVTRLRGSLRRTKLEISAVKDPDRRALLSTQWSDADVSIREVAAALHAFDQRRVELGLSESQARISRLVAELAKH